MPRRVVSLCIGKLGQPGSGDWAGRVPDGLGLFDLLHPKLLSGPDLGLIPLLSRGQTPLTRAQVKRQRRRRAREGREQAFLHAPARSSRPQLAWTGGAVRGGLSEGRARPDLGRAVHALSADHVHQLAVRDRAAVGLHRHLVPPVDQEGQPPLFLAALLLAAQRAHDAVAEVALEHEVAVLPRVGEVAVMRHDGLLLVAAAVGGLVEHERGRAGVGEVEDRGHRGHLHPLLLARHALVLILRKRTSIGFYS